jgi:hypothetical protein
MACGCRPKLVRRYADSYATPVRRAHLDWIDQLQISRVSSFPTLTSFTAIKSSKNGNRRKNDRRTIVLHAVDEKWCENNRMIRLPYRAEKGITLLTYDAALLFVIDGGVK